LDVAREHRRLHRPGNAPKIESDPELQAFILSRIDETTFVGLAREVKERFGSKRGVGKSAINEWYHRHKAHNQKS
jgi:hypothetical protein